MELAFLSTHTPSLSTQKHGVDFFEESYTFFEYSKPSSWLFWGIIHLLWVLKPMELAFLSTHTPSLSTQNHRVGFFEESYTFFEYSKPSSWLFWGIIHLLWVLKNMELAFLSTQTPSLSTQKHGVDFFKESYTSFEYSSPWSWLF
jgi:hypothetical protein